MLPGGQVQSLLAVPPWNFRWQQDYRYSTAVRLPKGTSIAMKYTFDNSAKNTANPQRPPQPVYYGPRSIDEMASLGLQLLTATKAEGDSLVQLFDQRETTQNIEAGQAQVRRDPGNAEGQVLLGGSYVDAGRYADAIGPLTAAVQLNPNFAPSRNYLGGALVALGRVSDGILHLQKAIALSPRDERYHLNLGNALNVAGRPAESAAEYERALAINTDFGAAHANLGLLFFSRGRFAEALPHLARAAELAPESAVAESDLGGVLGAMGRKDEARVHLRRALELQPGYGPALENLSKLR